MVRRRLSLLISLFHFNRMGCIRSLSPPPPPPPPPLSLSSSWIWPSCNHPRTHSFKVADDNDEATKCAAADAAYYLELSEQCFSNSSADEWESLSTTSEASFGAGDGAEAVMRGLRSDRLIYEPGGASSMAEEAAAAIKEAQVGGGCRVPFEGSVAMALDSRDPYRDFKKSMEDMVAAQAGSEDWEWLEEMLAWYLRVNGRANHVFVVGAFLDLILSLASSAAAWSSSSSNLSPTSSCSSSFSYTTKVKLQEEEQQQKNGSCTN